MPTKPKSTEAGRKLRARYAKRIRPTKAAFEQLRADCASLEAQLAAQKSGEKAFEDQHARDTDTIATLRCELTSILDVCHPVDQIGRDIARPAADPAWSPAFKVVCDTLDVADEVDEINKILSKDIFDLRTSTANEIHALTAELTAATQRADSDRKEVDRIQAELLQANKELHLADERAKTLNAEREQAVAALADDRRANILINAKLSNALAVIASCEDLMRDLKDTRRQSAAWQKLCETLRVPRKLTLRERLTGWTAPRILAGPVDASAAAVQKPEPFAKLP